MSQITTHAVLDNGIQSLLTSTALELLADDPITFARHDDTPRVEQRAPRDLQSIQEAFNRHSRLGSSDELMMASACCCCTPACCCTAVAVVKAAA